MFGKKDRDSPPPLPSSHSNIADSAYASSEGESRAKMPNLPMDNPGNIQGVSSDRNLEVNQSNGDVVDRDTGEVVSTVTTTTTTTTVRCPPFQL